MKFLGTYIEDRYLDIQIDRGISLYGNLVTVGENIIVTPQIRNDFGLFSIFPHLVIALSTLQ